MWIFQLFLFLRCYEKGCIALDEVNFVELRFALVTHRLTNPLRGLGRMGTLHGCYCYKAPDVSHTIKRRKKAKKKQHISCISH